MSIFEQIVKNIPALGKGVKATYLNNIINKALSECGYSPDCKISSLSDAYLFIAMYAEENQAQLSVLKFAYEEMMTVYSRDQIIECLRVGTVGLGASYSTVLTNHIHEVAKDAIKNHELVLSREFVSFFYCYGVCPYVHLVGWSVSDENIPEIIAANQGLINAVAKGGIEDLNILTKVLFGKAVSPEFSKYMTHPSDAILELEYNAYLLGQTSNLVNLLSIAKARFSCRGLSKADRKRDSDKKLKFASKILADVVSTKSALILYELNIVCNFMTEDVLSEVVSLYPELFKLKAHSIYPNDADFAKELLDSERDRILLMRSKLCNHGHFKAFNYKVDKKLSSSFRDIYQYDDPVYSSESIQIASDGTYFFDHGCGVETPLISMAYINLLLHLSGELNMPLALLKDAEFIYLATKGVLVDRTLNKAIALAVSGATQADIEQLSEKEKTAIILLSAINCSPREFGTRSITGINVERGKLIAKLSEIASSEVNHVGIRLSKMVDFMRNEPSLSLDNTAMVSYWGGSDSGMKLTQIGKRENTNILNRFFARVVGVQDRDLRDFNPMAFACLGSNIPFDGLKLAATGTLNPLSEDDAILQNVELNPVAENILSYSNHYKWKATLEKINILASYFQYGLGRYIYDDLGDRPICGGYIVGDVAYIYQESSWYDVVSSIERYGEDTGYTVDKIIILNVDLDYKSVLSCEISLNEEMDNPERLPPLTLGAMKFIEEVYWGVRV